LHLAAQLGHVEVVECLLENGASVNMVEVDKWSSLHLACERKRIEVVKVLLEQPDIDIELGQKYGLFSSLIICKPDILYSNGYTALHFAAQENSPEIAEMLLAKGALIDPWDNSRNYTPLGLACFGGKEAVANILLQHVRYDIFHKYD